MTIFERLFNKHFLKVAKDINTLRDLIRGLSVRIEELVYEYLKPKIDRLDEDIFWKQAFWGTTKIADYKENALCTVPSTWKELRIEYKLKNSTQSEFVVIYNDIESRARKAYSLGQGVADIVMETDGRLKCFSVTEPNVRILGVFWR